MRNLNLKPEKIEELNKPLANEGRNHSDIPELRSKERCTFSSTGVGYLGPLLCLPVYGEEEKLHKVFTVIYTCAATRDVMSIM